MAYSIEPIAGRKPYIVTTINRANLTLLSILKIALVKRASYVLETTTLR